MEDPLNITNIDQRNIVEDNTQRLQSKLMPPIKFIFSGAEELIALSSFTFPKKQQIAVQQAYHSLRRAIPEWLTHTNSASSHHKYPRWVASYARWVVDEFLLLAYFRITKGEAIAER